MQPDVVVMFDVAGDDPLGVAQRKGRAGSDALGFDGAMPAFDLAVGLWIERRDLGVGHAGNADEFLEILGDELRPDPLGRLARRPAGAVMTRGRTSAI